MNPNAYLQPLWLSLKVASVSTLGAFAVGVGLAFYLARGRSALRDWIDALFSLPLVLPPTVFGYYLIVSFGRRGWIGKWLDQAFGVSLLFTWQGAALAAGLVSVPFVVKAARAAFEEVPRNLETVARVLGCRPKQVFLWVTLPLAWRGILAGTVMAFARALGEFGATLMVAGNLPGKTQTLSLAIYSAVEAGNDSLALTLVLILSIVGVCVVLGSRRLLRPA